MKNVSDLLAKFAVDYVSAEDLYRAAKKGLLRPNEGKKEFVALMRAWMKTHKGQYYTELPFGGGFVLETPTGAKIGLIRVRRKEGRA